MTWAGGQGSTNRRRTTLRRRSQGSGQSRTEATHMLISQCRILFRQPNHICCQLLGIPVVQQGLWVDPNMVSWTGPADGARQHLVLRHCGVQLRSASEPFCAPEPARQPYSRRRKVSNCELLKGMHGRCCTKQGLLCAAGVCLPSLHDV